MDEDGAYDEEEERTSISSCLNTLKDESAVNRVEQSLHGQMHPATESEIPHTNMPPESDLQPVNCYQQKLIENTKRQCDLMEEQNAIMRKQCRLNAENNVLQAQIVTLFDTSVKASSMLHTSMTDFSVINGKCFQRLIEMQEVNSQNWASLTALLGHQENNNNEVVPRNDENSPVSESSSGSSVSRQLTRASTQNSATNRKEPAKKRKRK